MNFELDRLPEGPFLAVMAFLNLSELSHCCSVSSRFRDLVGARELLWTAQFDTYAIGRVYVVPALAILARGKEAVEEAERGRIQALRGMRVKKLKAIISQERIVVRPGTLVEKRDFVEAISNWQYKAIETSKDALTKLIRCPRLLVRPKEVYPKAALRLAKEDETRYRISESELCSFKFHIRIRADGPIGEVKHLDPWYSNVGHGTAKFSLSDHSVTFRWPFVNGVEMNPFQVMGMSNPLTLKWELAKGGAIIQLLELHGDFRGPQEIVCRHPVHGGFVLFSMGSVWTSFPMPPCGSDGKCVDAMLRDENLTNLPNLHAPRNTPVAV